MTPYSGGMAQKRLTIGIAPDSFKGNLTALEAATCIERGLRRGMGRISVRKIPMADGGEGTVRAIVEATGGTLLTRTVKGPRGKAVRAHFGMSGDGRTAVMEMAEASGLALLTPQQRNPMVTSTYGTGQLIKAALQKKVQKVLVGIGGSATNDGGMGMAKAVGIRFLDARGKELPEGGGALQRLARIDASGLDKRLRGVRVEVACDVDNPLAGPQGAAYVYGPQKGASAAMVKKLDAGLRNLAKVIKRDLGKDIAKVPGAGAAGGLGAGLMAFLDGVLRPGVDIVIDSVKLERKLKGCDLVITAEGRMDGQTVYGKTPAGVAKIAKKLGIPVIGLAGCFGNDVKKVHSIGIDAIMCSLTESIEEHEIPLRGPDMLADCAEEVGRLLMLRV